MEIWAAAGAPIYLYTYISAKGQMRVVELNNAA